MGVALVIVVLCGCARQEESVVVRPTSHLERIKSRGVLRVVTRYAPTTLYEGPERRLGFEHDLAEAFARALGVVPRFIILDSQKEILEALRNQEGDLAAAGLIRSPEMDGDFRLGPVYQEVDQQVVCRRGGRRPTTLAKLAKVRLAVPRGGSYEARLQELRATEPELSWISDPERSSEQIFEQVVAGTVDCTVADSNVVAVNRRYYPELVVKFPINAAQPLSWVLPRASPELQQEVTNWFENMREEGRLAALEERYFGYFKDHQYDYVDNRAFIRRIDERLPGYIVRFKDASRRYGLPWPLLAAVAYQESHWDPDAISPTGVKGIMMLTQDTATTLGVKNRKNPREAILAGAWYLAELRRRLPAEIRDPDRTWIALAAYNAGLGHLLDVREMAVSQGKDPNSWGVLRDLLPLLANKEHYAKTKHGYAPGMQPVRYVRKVRYYYDVLVQREAMLARQPLKPDPIPDRPEESAQLPRPEETVSATGSPDGATRVARLEEKTDL
ncbi:MAG: membrane-bound lytic murein transglycosylase MltF [Magnetococcales bacterium]|nr:membrane-bound lytic murein transglycosylase MltF [Magnetococcales bacterium]